MPAGKWKNAARNVGLAVVVVPALFFLLGQLAGWALGAGTIGVTTSDEDETLIVDRGGPAAKAGIQTGDRIVVPPSVLYRVGWYGADTAIGKPYSIHVKRINQDRTFRVVGIRDETRRWPSASQIITFVIGLAFIGTGSFLFVRVTTTVTWAIVLLTVTQGVARLNIALFAAYFTPYFIFFVVWFCSAVLVFPWATAVVAVRFPNESSSMRGRLFERSMAPFGLVLAASVLISLTARLHLFPISAAWNSLRDGPQLLPLLAGTIAFIWRGVRSAPETRKRLQWVLAGFAIYVAAEIASHLLMDRAPSPYPDVVRLAELALPASIAYAVLRQRVLDTRLVLGRAVVYSGVTFVLVLSFIGIDIVSEKWLAETGLAAGVQLAAAAASGFALRLLHRRIEDAANHLFFHERATARKRLDEAVETLLHAESGEAIGEFLISEPVAALHLGSAALFVRNGSTFVRTRSVGWGETDIRELAAGDPLLARIHAHRGSLDLAALGWHRDDVPTAAATPLLLQPVQSRGHVVAMSFYGGRTAGDALDGSELHALQRLAAAASAAFDHVESNRMRLEIAELHRQLAVFQAASA